MGEGEQRPEHVAHFVLQRVAEQQRVEEQRVEEDGRDLQVLWKRPPLPSASHTGFDLHPNEEAHL